ncbi:MAG: hypothetical protein LBG06_10875 [Deltaproteobacteria bacterium]|nr:hypothetical protein [Deltaproteobacteria bacterium]
MDFAAVSEWNTASRSARACLDGYGYQSLALDLGAWREASPRRGSGVFLRIRIVAFARFNEAFLSWK